eukprot:5224741-Pleurochrysis_carterae.AAC.2
MKNIKKQLQKNKISFSTRIAAKSKNLTFVPVFWLQLARRCRASLLAHARTHSQALQAAMSNNTANWKLRSSNKVVWKYEGNTCVPRDNPNADFENSMIAYVGEWASTRTATCSSARTAGKARSSTLVADRKQYFDELLALAADDGESLDDADEAGEGGDADNDDNAASDSQGVGDANDVEEPQPSLAK